MSSSENILTPDKAFVTLALVSIMNLTLTLLPQAVAALGQASVSFRRIKTFLELGEVDEDDVLCVTRRYNSTYYDKDQVVKYITHFTEGTFLQDLLELRASLVLHV